MKPRPLDGIRVVSLAEQYPGPLATFQLAELGAEVIQLERPGKGDPQRTLNPELFRAAGLNKKSVTLDLKDEQGHRAASVLIGTADVLVEGFRPGVMDRLGFGYEMLQRKHPKLVYCSISGFGQTGRNRDTSGHNINYEAVVGGLDPYIRPAGPKYHEATLPFGDIMAGMTASLGIVAAIHHASKTGQGTYLDVAIADSLLLALSPQLGRALSGSEVWTQREAAWGVFECTDGYIALGIAHEDHFWTALCEELDLQKYNHLDHPERVKFSDELRQEIRHQLRRRSVDTWMERLATRGVPCSPARSLEEVATAPDIVERDMLVEVSDFSGDSYTAVRSPLSRPWASELTYSVPDLGEDTNEILRDLGVLSEDERNHPLSHKT